MASHSDIITKARALSPVLFDFQNKGESFVYHMKILNAALLLRIPGFSLGIPFFPGLDELTTRLAEAYLNDRRAAGFEPALQQAKQDRVNIEKAVKEVLG